MRDSWRVGKSTLSLPIARPRTLYAQQKSGGAGPCPHAKHAGYLTREILGTEYPKMWGFHVTSAKPLPQRNAQESLYEDQVGRWSSSQI